MSATHLVLTDESKFNTTVKTAYESAKSHDQQLWIYITGAIVPETGKSWCPDCTAAKPNLEKLAGTAGNYVIECPVERSKYRGVPSKECESGEGCKLEKHPYKADPKLGLTAIPTLFKVDMANLDNDYAKLVESDVYNDTKFKAFTGI